MMDSFNYKHPEYQYLTLMRNILESGVMVDNPRTNSKCLTLLNYQIKFDGDVFPLVTTRKSYWKQAILEMICYMRAYTQKQQFNDLGVHTWDANIENWDSRFNPDKYFAGIIYGASSEQVGLSYQDLVEQIKQNPYDRGHIWNFWNPEYFKFGCLRPCMFLHHFNVVNDTLYLTSTQRSQDVCLGGNFNMIQAWFLLNITAKLTGLRVGDVTMNIANCHIYENQIEQAKIQVQRQPFNPPTIEGIFEGSKSKGLTMDDILNHPDPLRDVRVLEYMHWEPIKYEFTV